VDSLEIVREHFNFCARGDESAHAATETAAAGEASRRFPEGERLPGRGFACLMRHFDRAAFTDDGHLDLARILEVALDVARDLV
jgi:hypothetical protein